MNLARLLFVCILALSFTTAALDVSVVTHDTDTQSTYKHLKACSCGGTQDSFRIKNIGMLEATYVFSLESENREWFTLERTSAYLQPGQTIDVLVYANVPCDYIGTVSYDIYVASEYGRYRAFHKTIESGVCENILADIAPIYLEVEPCGTERLSLTIENVATFRDTYAVQSGFGFPTVTLDAGEQAVLRGEYTASCSEWGSKVVPVTITSLKNQQSVTKHVTVNVPRHYDYDVAFGSIERPVCIGVQSAVPIIVHNTEPRANSVSLTLGEDEATVSIAGNSAKVVDLAYTPTRAGDATLTLEAVGGNGSIEKTSQLTIPVEACYGFSLSAPEPVSACPGTVTMPFTIRSDGTQVQPIWFDVQSNATTSIDGKTTLIRPGEQLVKDVTVQVLDADRSYYVTLNVSSEFRDAQATTQINGYSTESCYAVSPDSHKFRVWTDQTLLPVVITHTGLKPATYTVSYSGEFATAQETQITLAPDESTVLHLNLTPAGFETGRYVDRLMLSSNGVDYVTDFEITLREKGFWQHFLDAVRWDQGFLICSIASIIAAIILLLVFAAAIGIALGGVVYENPRSLSKQTAFIIGAALIIILLIVAIANTPQIPRTYERPIGMADPSGLYYEVGQADTVAISLNQYFADPDNDTLTYVASQSEYVQVRIDGDTALVKADTKYDGDVPLVFTASDGRGGLTDSGVITVRVVPYKPVTFLEYWRHVCHFATAIFLLAAVLIALLVIVTRGEPPKKLKRKEQHGIILYQQPRTEVVEQGAAQELVESVGSRIEVLPSGQVIGTQVQAGSITINQAKKSDLFVASAGGTKFHRTTCPIVKGMPKAKRLTFEKQADAIKAGYTPCKTCSSSE